MKLSFQKLFYVFATLFALFATMHYGKVILIPLSFALMLSFILYPMVKKLESLGMNEMFAAFLSMLGVFLSFAGATILLSTQIIELSEEFSQFRDKILSVFADVTLFVNNNVNFVPNVESGDITDEIKNWLNNSAGTLVKETFSGTAGILSGVVSTVVFLFLILIYKKGLVNALVEFYPKEKQEKARHLFRKIQQVGQKYLFGVILIILILGMINSIGLLIIGLDSPFLFGYLAAVLAIVPYVGTLVGAAIPVLYAFISYDSLLMPLAVALLFWAVQVIESNFLSPKIVGGSLKINALASIMSIIIGASVWGVAGMILFLPFTAILKVICEEYTDLKPVALLIGEENYKKDSNSDSLIVKWGSNIKSWFSNKNK
ncbi:MAG: AI-2E family transporter [Chitinophagales bacterium]